MNKRVTLPLGAPVLVYPPVELRGRPTFLFHPDDPDKPKPQRGRPRKYAILNEPEIPYPEYRELFRQKEKAQRLEDIAVLDFETDPFDNTKQDEFVEPFLAVLHGDNFDDVVIWDEDFTRFIAKVIAAIMALPRSYMIYAHNGGRFDYMYLMQALRGRMSFKGRGLMQAKIGNHTIRDSFHIIPESLANLQKENFDYTKLVRNRRNKYREEIIRYCISDCVYLLEHVKAFIARHGFKISIGQAAMAGVKKVYTVRRLGRHMDDLLRPFYWGGRVECLAYAGIFRAGAKGKYKLYDVNSMYPGVMTRYQHPIGNHPIIRNGEPPNKNTVFLHLKCRQIGRVGAFPSHDESGSMVFNCKQGEFKVTIWEYDIALKHRLIADVEFIQCVDFPPHDRTDFSKFILPLYEEKEAAKRKMEDLEKAGLQNTGAYFQAKCDYINSKLIQNNSYGKFAQDPNRYGEWYYTDEEKCPPIDCRGCKANRLVRRDNKRNGTNNPDPWPVNLVTNIHTTPDGGMAECRSWGHGPLAKCDGFWVWKRPPKVRRYNNVATAASITGAARAELLDKLATAVDPLYCDTDSIICRDLPGAEIHKTKLSAWDIEKTMDEVTIKGKKLYGYLDAKYPPGHDLREIVKCKGAPAAGFRHGKRVAGLTYSQLQRLRPDKGVLIVANSPTQNRFGVQGYQRRIIRQTTPDAPKSAGRKGLSYERAPRVSRK